MITPDIKLRSYILTKRTESAWSGTGQPGKYSVSAKEANRVRYNIKYTASHIGVLHKVIKWKLTLKSGLAEPTVYVNIDIRVYEYFLAFFFCISPKIQ